MHRMRRNVLVISVSALALSPLVIFAWTGPTQSPPSGNVAAPINVGTTDQVKNGNIGVNGLVVFGNSLLGGFDDSDAYLNFGDTSGSAGYGIRDNNGLLEFRNSSSTWQSLQSVLWNLCGGPCGGDGQWTTSGTNIYNSNSGNVGIGTQSPKSSLDVVGGLSVRNNTSGIIPGYIYTSQSDEPASYDEEMVISLEDASSMALGDNRSSIFIGPNNTTGGVGRIQLSANKITVPAGNFAIGTESPVGKLTVQGALGQWGGYVTGTYGLYGQGSGGQGLYGYSSGHIGVQGNSAASWGGYFSGVYGVYIYGGGADMYMGYAGYALYSGYTVGAGSYQTFSDRRLKTALRPLEDKDGLAAILKLQPVNYQWKDAERDTREGEAMGFIAQDVEDVLPSAVKTGLSTTITLADGTKETITGTKTIEYNKITVSLVKAVQELKANSDSAVQELNANNESLRAEVASLKVGNAALKREIEELRSALRTK